MTRPQAPAGWYPDPSDDGVIRYWDGTTWTEQAAASTQPSDDRPETEATPLESDVVQRDDRNSWQAIPIWAKIGAGVLVAILVIATIAYSANDAPDNAFPYGMQPSQERAVVELVRDARDEYDSATNDLQKNSALASRDERICALLGDGRVENWTGQVYSIDASSDGMGVLGINIESKTQVKTRDSGFADSEGTLIGPGPLLERVTNLKTGQVVTFSGRFIPDDRGESCFTNPRLTQDKRIAEPLMLFRFSDVHQ